MFSAEEINTAEAETVLSIAFEEQRTAYNYFVNQINKHVTIHNSLSFNKILLMCQETIVMNQESAEIFNQLIQSIMDLHRKYGSKFVKKLYDYIKNKQTQEMSQFSGGISLISLRSSQVQQQQSQVLGHPDQMGMLTIQHRFLDLQKRKSNLRNSYNVLRVEKLQLKNIYSNIIQVKLIKYKDLLLYQQQLCLKKEGVQDDLFLQVQKPQELLKLDYINVKAQLNYLQTHDPIVDSAKLSYKQLRRSQTKSPAPQVKFDRQVSPSVTGQFNHREQYEAMRKKIIIPLQSARYMLLQLKGVDFPTSRRLMMIKYLNRLKMLLKLYICYKKCLTLMEFEYGDTVQLHCIAQQRFVLFQKLSQKFRAFILQQKLRQIQKKQQKIYVNYEQKVDSQILLQMTQIQSSLRQQIQENAKKVEFVNLLRQQKQAFLNDKRKVWKILSIRIFNIKKEIKVETRFIAPMITFVFGKIIAYKHCHLRRKNADNAFAYQTTILTNMYMCNVQFLHVQCKKIQYSACNLKKNIFTTLLDLKQSFNQLHAKKLQYLKLKNEKEQKYVKTVPFSKLQTRHLRLLSRFTSYNMSMLLVWRNVRDQLRSMQLRPQGHEEIQEKMARFYTFFIQKQQILIKFTEQKLQKLLKLHEKKFLMLELWFLSISRQSLDYKKMLLVLNLAADSLNTRMQLRDNLILKKALKQKQLALSGYFLRQSSFMNDKWDDFQQTAQKIYKLVQEMTQMDVNKSRWQHYFTDLISLSKTIVQDPQFQKGFLNVKTDTELELLIQLSFQERQQMHDISSLELAKTIVILLVQQCTFQSAPALLFPAVYRGSTMLFTGVFMQRAEVDENLDSPNI